LNAYESSVDGSQVARKITIRLVVPLLALLLLNSIDRVNMSFAALQMNADLGLTPKTYGLAVSWFFVGYILLQIPSIWLLQRIGMRRWVFTIALLWGLAATAMAFVQSKEQLYLLRIVIGIAEGGYAPGLVWYLSQWMPARYRASSIGIVMLAVPISVIAGAPLSGWLMSGANAFGWPGWRWMFLVEGLPTIILATAALKLFVDAPKDAPWLTAAEKRWLQVQLADEQKSHSTIASSGALLGIGRLWLAAVGWFALMTGAYGVIYWLPLVIKQLSASSSDMEVILLSALPWIAVGVGMVANSRHSDRTQERRLHVSLATLATGVCLALAALSGASVWALVFLILAGLCMGGGHSTFWTVPPTFLSAAAAASGIAVINMCGNLAGLVGPVFIGWIRERTGSFTLPVFAMAAVLLIGGTSLLLIRPRVHSIAPNTGA
jgi:MFS transporter, ACS family, tartrate transporter